MYWSEAIQLIFAMKMWIIWKIRSTLDDWFTVRNICNDDRGTRKPLKKYLHVIKVVWDIRLY